MHTETDETMGELIHQHQNPMAFEENGPTSKQVDAPKAILHVADEDEPRRATLPRFWSKVIGQYASDNTLIDLDIKRLGNNQRNPRTAETLIASFALDNGAEEWLGGAFRPRLRSFLRREQPAVLPSHQTVVRML